MKEIIKSIRNNKFEATMIIVVLILYAINNMIIKPNTQGRVHEFFLFYFNDLMAPLFMLSYTNILLGTRNLRMARIEHILIFTFVAGCVWEIVGPLFKKSSYADWNDILCYIAGALVYAGLTYGKNKAYRS